MPTQPRGIPALAAEFAAAHPDLDPFEQRLVLAAFRVLGEGQPFGAEELAVRVDLPVDEVASHLAKWPMVERDEHGRVVAFSGLTLKPTTHALDVGGRRLYAWGALDTLFLPELLGRPARFRSTSPDTGEVISLVVDGSGVRDVSPQSAVMTLHEVGGFDLRDVVGTFCCFVHFFVSEQTASAWAERSKGTYVVSIADGFEYGRHYNHRRFGAALAGDVDETAREA